MGPLEEHRPKAYSLVLELPAGAVVVLRLDGLVETLQEVELVT